MASDRFPSFIASQLSYLMNHFSQAIKVEQAWCGSKNHSGVLDRFTLCIPYCLDYIKWDIIYNAEFPLSAPDVVFGPEDEHFHPFRLTSGQGGEEMNPLKSVLSNWSYKDPTRLFVLIQELRNEYILYQQKRAGAVDDDRLMFEIDTIMSREGIEILVSSGPEKPEEVKFAVPLLDMDINKMVRGCSWRHIQKIHLQAVYSVPKRYMSSPSAPRLKLVSTPELKTLFSVEDVKLPSWVSGMCMAEYLPHLEESLRGQIREAVASIDVRRCFIEALAPLFGRPLEAEPIFCRRATFLVASGVFSFMVHFSIPTQFPRQQPGLMLMSSQHFSSQHVPIKSAVRTDYPWSPRWEPSQMAERLFDFLVDEGMNFKKYCNEMQLQV
ncbi:hypothetical protein SAY86_006082 [Trapa natans]|uniref:BRISC and BRCA1-A complex member 2 n=1 Tax=Trapa natans TaxID=22666 RepID=A0AAN7L5X8_TRANT|nr:hypothetical protein SAY86_006082 [Trapa natans]